MAARRRATAAKVIIVRMATSPPRAGLAAAAPLLTTSESDFGMTVQIDLRAAPGTAHCAALSPVRCATSAFCAGVAWRSR